ncbi:unnamed protein product [Hydatigera taeniaeformis]|uniref:RGS domain-containing protein n=1 Tax=Hydatigena taeniaeformis TaxID=6205 RepID=A0A0R3X0A2_HYDTA|nr:unnamed protein product [Hydatigera taeniaeformis]
MSLGFSRLCPLFENVIRDPLLLSYFVQYLRTINSENTFRFWLELSGCMNRTNVNEDSSGFKSKESVSSDEMIAELREKISHLPVNNVTTIYFRYISCEAKLPVELPQKLLSATLSGDPTSALLTFLMAVNAYKKEFTELMLKEDQAESVDERHQQLLHDATTICAKYLSPASDDFMGLTSEQYRGVLDAACAEKEPRENCFDDLYKLIHKTVEKNILPSFFVSVPFSRYRDKIVSKPGYGALASRLRKRYIRKNLSGRRQPPRQLAPIQLNVLALSDASLANRLPRVYLEETNSLDGITRRLARCDIVAIGDRPLAGRFRGIIRREDIRAAQRDRAEPTLSFRPGDLVRARVINIVGSSSGAYVSTCLPDAEACCPEVGAVVAAARAVAGAVQPSPAHGVTGSSAATTTYLLSTAEEELGVVLGLGRPPLSGTASVLGATSGCPLLPTSWTEMICPRTLVRFPRKVARVPDELLKVLLCNSEEFDSSK